MTSGSMQNYHYKDEMNNDTNNLTTDNTETATIKAFTYKSAIIEKTPDNDQTVYTEVVAPLKYLITF